MPKRLFQTYRQFKKTIEVKSINKLQSKISDIKLYLIVVTTTTKKNTKS